MIEQLSNFIFSPEFMPHGHCYFWTPSLLWLYVIADGLIATSYYTIPLAIVYFTKKRPDVQFNWIFMMFSLFIFACGTTHLIGIVTIWKPIYWIDASLKGLTAIASCITGIMLWRLMPLALSMPSNTQLANTVAQLEKEVEQRVRAESSLANLNNELERLVEKRTRELTLANEQLLEEIKQRKRTEQALFIEQQQAMVTLASIGDGVITTNLNSEVTYLNPIAERMTGWTKLEAFGRPILEVFRILNEGTRKLAPNPVDVVLAHGEICGLANHTLLISKSGEEYAIEDSAAPILDENGTLLGVVLVFHDVSDTKKMALKMAYLAEHDYLTDLPNRLLLNDRITQALSAAKRRNGKTALMFFDIDNFKKVNDTLGHEIGDLLLKQLSKNLQLCLRGSDTISRQGGDEFIILLPEVNDEIAPAEIAQKLLDITKQKYIVGPHELYISASIGIAVYPDDGITADVLTRNADAAMYHAKNMGKNNYQFFTSEMSERVAEQLSLENNLQRAISQNEFELYYQPKISLTTNQLVGAEALIRWNHPEWGMLTPDRFIPVAEESGLIRSIGSWVLREACQQNRLWQEAGYSPIVVAVNLSATELYQPNFLQEMTRLLLQSGLSPEYLELEVTESVAIQGEARTLQELQKLKEMGVRLSVDDFGTGYSSLSYIKRLPIDTVKIDKSFVRDIKDDPNDAAIVTAIISMSHSLKLSVIAEGVETLEQLEFLRDHDCDEVQGYYFSKPLTASQFEAQYLKT